MITVKDEISKEKMVQSKVPENVSNEICRISTKINLNPGYKNPVDSGMECQDFGIFAIHIQESPDLVMKNPISSPPPVVSFLF